MRTALLNVLLWGTLSSGIAWGAAGKEVYAPPAAADLKAQVDAWLVQRNLHTTPVPEAIAPLWQFEANPTSEQLFDSLLKTFYFADEDVRKLVESCRTGSLHTIPSLDSILVRDREPLLTNNVQFFLGRHLAVAQLYEEALLVLSGLDPHVVVDPAGYFFYKGVCEHHLLQKEPGLETLGKLLHDTEQVPVRYRQLSELMLADLEQVEEKSIGEVARQMKDVQRRLDLGRAGQGVQRVEDKIIQTLDEIIEKLEQQQNGGGGGGMAQGQPGGKPADDGYIGGIKGPGQTDRKDIGHKDDWGDLPPKAQTAAKNMLDQKFPAHYRQAVEEYLKKIAERPAP